MQVKAYTCSTIGLRICINQERLEFKNGQTCGYIDGSRCFPNSPFLIGNTNYSSPNYPKPRKVI